jgi:hypothetical protein
MAKRLTFTTNANTSKDTKASSERVTKTIHKIATVSTIALSAYVFTATPGSAQRPPRRQYCLSYNAGGTDCSFTSYAQCEATASGQGAECYGNTPSDDRDPWNARAQQFSRPRF